MATDPFFILGVDEDASDDEIKRRYLALVRSFPPDREPERFQTYRAAFEALHTERDRLAAKLRRRAREARGGLSAVAGGAPERRVSEAQVTALLVEGIQQALTRWEEVSRAGASRTDGAG